MILDILTGALPEELVARDEKRQVSGLGCGDDVGETKEGWENW